MKYLLLSLLAFACAPALAQTTTNTSNAGSNAESASASQSGASSDNKLNNQVGAGANAALTYAPVSNYAATQPLKNQTIKGNAAVPLAASVSFSSDYCGGTVSAGASALGVSLGMAAPKMDGNCQSLRRAEKFGVAAANAYSAGLSDVAAKLINMQVWEICMAETNAKQVDAPQTQSACEHLGLIGAGSLPSASSELQTPAAVSAPPPPAAAQKVIITGSNGASTTIEPDPAKRVPRP